MKFSEAILSGENTKEEDKGMKKEDKGTKKYAFTNYEFHMKDGKVITHLIPVNVMDTIDYAGGVFNSKEDFARGTTGCGEEAFVPCRNVEYITIGHRIVVNTPEEFKSIVRWYCGEDAMEAVLEASGFYDSEEDVEK